jgi:hypothetical protein
LISPESRASITARPTERTVGLPEKVPLLSTFLGRVVGRVRDKLGDSLRQLNLQLRRHGDNLNPVKLSFNPVDNLRRAMTQNATAASKVEVHIFVSVLISDGGSFGAAGI